MRPAVAVRALPGLALGALALPLALAVAAPAGAAQVGTVRGVLVNGTAGGPVPARAEVVLHVFRGEAHAEDRQDASDENGAFVFEGVDSDPGLSYQVTAAYGGGVYATDALRFAPGEQDRAVQVRVYDSTGADPGLRVRRASLIIVGTDAASQTARVVELVTLENPSDRTYVPSATGAAGPMGLLRFPLPPSAGDLERGPGLEDAEIIQVDRGFATDRPVPPGASDVLFSYRVPYQRGRLAYTRAVPYPTDELRVLAPRAGPSVSSPSLRPAEPLLLGELSYQVLLARDLGAGGQVELAFDGLPSRWPLGLPLDALPAPVWGAAGVAVALLLAGGVAWRAGRGVGGRPRSEAVIARDQQALLDRLASLDQAFELGRLPEPAYRAQRAEAKARLLDVLRASGPAGAPGSVASVGGRDAG